MRIIEDLGVLERAPCQLLGVSPAVLIDQEKISLFALATGDDQWIHVDPIAAANSLYGTTIVHGYLALSIIVRLEMLTYEIKEVKMRLNYGIDRLRFISPLKVGSEVFAEIYATKLERIGKNAKLFKDIALFVKNQERPILKVSNITYLVLE